MGGVKVLGLNGTLPVEWNGPLEAVGGRSKGGVAMGTAWDGL